MHVLQAEKELLHNGKYLMLFVELNEPFPPSLLDVLGETHFHVLKHYVKPTVIVFYPLGIHHVWAVNPLVLVKPLENLNFSLIESFLFSLVFIFELFDRVEFTVFDVAALVNLAKTSRAYKFTDFIFSP